MSNPNRGSMGGCSHTNSGFYGANGCSQCDDALDDWLRKQEEEKTERELQALRERVAELEKQKSG